MTIIEHKVVLHQCITLEYALGEDNYTQYLLPGKNQPLLTQKRHKKYSSSDIII